MSSRTGSRLLLVALLCSSCGLLGAQDWESFAASSTRSQDRILIQTMNAGSLETRIAVCRGAGRRQDMDVEPVFDSLLSAWSPGTAAQTELLLRVIIASARSAHPADQDLGAWIAANSRTTDAILADMARWRSPMLKVELVALAVIARGPVGLRALLDAGSGIAQELRASNGLLSGENTALALAFLDGAQRVGSPDLLPVCSEIARLSMDGTVVEAARRAAAASQG